MSQDCYTFTLGPGAGDFTFLITTDQVFKYRFRDAAAGHRMKIVMLPLHSHEYVEQATPLSRTEFGIPDGVVVSGSTNLWKSCFGDSEILLEGIAALIRKFPHYHHVFAGTPRCLDGLVAALDGDLLKDHRIQVMLAFDHDLFGDQERALDHARRAASLAIYDEIPARVAARLLVKHGHLAEAAAACPAPQGDGPQGVDEGNVVDILAGLPTDRLPLYYDY